MGRKKSADPKERIAHIRLRSVTDDAIKRIADATDRPTSAIMRLVIEEFAESFDSSKRTARMTITV